MLLTAWLCVLLPNALAADVLDDERWSILRQTEVQATSYLRSNWNKYTENYHPNYVADDNPATAWVEGVDGNGEGQAIVLPTLPIRQAKAVRLRVRNGYQKSKGLLQANAAPKKVRVAVLAGGQEVAHTTAELERVMGWQTIDVALPPGAGLSAVSLQVESVHPGHKYKDTCVSDVQVYVDTDIGIRPALESARHQKLLGWTQERKSQAAYFASLPPSYPFAGTAFTRRDGAGDDARDQAELHALAKQAKAAGSAGGWWRMTRKGAQPQVPDGLWGLSDVVDLFGPDSLAWFETDKRYAAHDKNVEEYGWSLQWRTHAKVAFAEGSGTTAPRTVWFQTHSSGEERGPWSTTTTHFVKLDARGRPELVYAETEADDELGPHLVQTRWRVHRTEAGQVDRVDLVSRREYRSTNWDPGDDFDPVSVDRGVFTVQGS